MSLLTIDRAFEDQILRQFICVEQKSRMFSSLLTVSLLVGRVVILCATRFLLSLPLVLLPQVCPCSPSAEGIALPPLHWRNCCLRLTFIPGGMWQLIKRFFYSWSISPLCRQMKMKCQICTLKKRKFNSHMTMHWDHYSARCVLYKDVLEAYWHF